ncbi:MAG TPA: S46 family peptidase [Bacteroidales bacterium]|nr:S46 family peptidase [Bacteroidales bacterium]
MKKILLILFAGICFHSSAAPVEGMWIPSLIEQLTLREMQELGLKLSAEDIYSVNHSSLKDAIVQFGGGCTGEIVSSAGLLLTNYHCGLGTIQGHSSLEHDYLNDGFWASDLKEELPCSGLTVTLLVRIEEVTARVLEGIDDNLPQTVRQEKILQHAKAIQEEAEKGTLYEARVRPFFYGNQYYLFVQEVFRDIRLVGAPPFTIGKFGGDTDNWMWPRHTGDFSVFRIYTDKNNQPAPYAADNVPYKPKYHLPVSVDGYREGDFTFVFGYPGTTREYLPACMIDLVVNQENPLRIGLREKRLDIINAAMEKDQLVRIQYTAKANSIANGWKKMTGESNGVRRVNGIWKKQQAEQKFTAWANTSPTLTLRYGSLLSEYDQCCREYLPYDLASLYLTEAGQAIEVVRFASGFRELVSQSRNKEPDTGKINTLVKMLRQSTTGFFKNYQPLVDEQIANVMIETMASAMEAKFRPVVIEKRSLQNKECRTRFNQFLFSRSLFTDPSRLNSFLENYKPADVRKLEKDPAYELMSAIYNSYEKFVLPEMKRFNSRFDSLHRFYMQGQMEMDSARTFYPDANSTLRIAFGKVEGYTPADAVTYRYFTVSDGILEKEDTAVYDYQVDSRLKKLFLEKDFGPYADRDGSLHVAFIASNHTTGGNSGSPVLNARGALIGLNFDRNWEGTQSDLIYDPAQCRNITLDIRYCLYIIDKFAKAGHLVDEMTLVRQTD